MRSRNNVDNQGPHPVNAVLHTKSDKRFSYREEVVVNHGQKKKLYLELGLIFASSSLVSLNELYTKIEIVGNLEEICVYLSTKASTLT